MTIGQLQRFLEQTRTRSRMTEEQWEATEVEVRVDRDQKVEDLRFNLNISDVCIDRLQVWVSPK